MRNISHIKDMICPIFGINGFCLRDHCRYYALDPEGPQCYAEDDAKLTKALKRGRTPYQGVHKKASQKAALPSGIAHYNAR